MKTIITAFIFLVLSFSTFAKTELNAVILKDSSIINSEDIFNIEFDDNSSNIISIELNDETTIDTSEIEIIILKHDQSLKKFQRGSETSGRAVIGNGNGSGG